MGSSDWLMVKRRTSMATPTERVRAAWTKSDSSALNREVDKLAGEGYSRQVLENALEVLLREVRTSGVDDETEEQINGVWDRLTGWCHTDRLIKTVDKSDDPPNV